MQRHLPCTGTIATLHVLPGHLQRGWYSEEHSSDTSVLSLCVHPQGLTAIYQLSLPETSPLDTGRGQAQNPRPPRCGTLSADLLGDPASHCSLTRQPAPLSSVSAHLWVTQPPLVSDQTVPLYSPVTKTREKASWQPYTTEPPSLRSTQNQFIENRDLQAFATPNPQGLWLQWEEGGTISLLYSSE